MLSSVILLLKNNNKLLRNEEAVMGIWFSGLKYRQRRLEIDSDICFSWPLGHNKTKKLAHLMIMNQWRIYQKGLFYLFIYLFIYMNEYCH